MNIGLYFGTFNPVHKGHLDIANYIVKDTDIEQLWFIISPLNPFKKKAALLSGKHRYELVNIAISQLADNNKLKASDIEFNLPQPSYTINTLHYLKKKHPEHNFVIIMGSDNLSSFHKWKNYEEILDNYEIYVYPRSNSDGSKMKAHEKVKFIDAPLIEISSSFIRKSIKQGRDIRKLLPDNVYKYISEMHFYKK